MNVITESETTRIPVNEAAEESFTPNVSVWLVDDNDRFRNTLAEFLGRIRGIRCERHFSSPDGLLSSLASQVGPDVVLLDIHMGDRNGLDAIAPIKALSPATQVLMLTSMYDVDGYNRALAEGASDFLLKSYTPEEIVERIRNPSRRVNARRRRAPKPACITIEARKPVPMKRGPTLFSGRLRFLRTLLG